ncbi:hypothetical protein [Albibacillus kandeliae]|uniref:hypothetical protein n=1 Tax=Albibacillus kandeliae TaxID=2174228 RepID=UPI000D68F45E|nr:hypothetical protein [Albibacillus kandeliae]
MMKHVVIVAPDGAASVTPVARYLAARREREAEEAARIAEVKVRGHVPEQCGPEIPEAPARGVFRVFEPQQLYPDGKDGYVSRPAGYRGRSAIQHADVFDVMAAKAARHRKPHPLTPSQIAMGRHYRDLVERHAAAGIRGSSLETRSSGRGRDAGDYMDRVLRDKAEIDRLRRRIGDGTAMVVRRIRPSKRGSRVNITDRRLVDMVCLEDKRLSEVLRKHGWIVNGETVKAIQIAIAAAFERMLN